MTCRFRSRCPSPVIRTVHRWRTLWTENQSDPRQRKAAAMLDVHVARNRAVCRAIETGEMPNFDLIHTMQKADGYQPCFGRTEEFCHETVCRWHGDCMALTNFGSQARPSIASPASRPFQRPSRSGAGTYRDSKTDRNEHDRSPQDQAEPADDAQPAEPVTGRPCLPDRSQPAFIPIHEGQ